MLMVTGGAGFIGSNFILEWFAENNEPLLNLDALTYAGNLENLQRLRRVGHYHFVHGDIADREMVKGLLKAYQPRAVLHFAAESHVDRSILGPEAFIQTNVLGTHRLLETVKEYWQCLSPEACRAFRFVHVSTDEVFGSLGPSDSAFVESSPYAPNSPYSASKAASDHLVRAYGQTYGLPVLTTHCSNNYGPFQFPEKLIPLMVYQALRGEFLPIYGDGRQVRDWLHVSDHCSALRAVLERGAPGETYNVGGNSEKTNLEVVGGVCRILDEWLPRADGVSYMAQLTHVPDRLGHDRRYAINAGKICNALGWQPGKSFEEGLRQTVRWYLDHQEWVEHVTSGAYRQWLNTHYSYAENEAN